MAMLDELVTHLKNGGYHPRLKSTAIFSRT